MWIVYFSFAPNWRWCLPSFFVFHYSRLRFYTVVCNNNNHLWWAWCCLFTHYWVGWVEVVETFLYSFLCILRKHIIVIPRQFNQIAIHMCSYHIKFYLNNIARFFLWPLCNPTMKLPWSPFPPPRPHDYNPTIR
jgi:hypothetical protein